MFGLLTALYVVVYWLLNIKTPLEQLIVILESGVVFCERVKCYAFLVDHLIYLRSQTLSPTFSRKLE